MKLKDKVAIITGGTSGIGLACAKDFLENGAKVVISSRRDATETAKELGENCKFVRCDVSNEEDVVNLVNETIKTFGKIDILVSNAGIANDNELLNTPTEEWDKIINVNLKGVFLTNKHVLKEMLKQEKGSIINMASIMGMVASGGSTAYCASKAGVVNLTRSAAISYSKKGIRFNAIAPGVIKTPILDGIPEEYLAPTIGMHPIGRIGFDHEVAKAVTFLASDDASFITGVVLPVDGGYTAQ